MHNSLNSAVSLDTHLSHLQDSAEMLNLILGRIALQILEEILEVHSGVYGLLYPASRTYKPCDWVVASGARLIDGVA